MQWYFAKDGERIGPLTDQEFYARVAAGEVLAETLVWHEGMVDWQPYSTMRSDAPPAPEATTDTESIQAAAPAASQDGKCAECGRTFPLDHLVSLGGALVCAECKPFVLQKMREGVDVAGQWHYGGFWIRAVAKIIDSIIVGILNFAVAIPLSLVALSQDSSHAAAAAFFLKFALSIGINASYTTFFLGRFAATPGKMACGLKVICADGSRVSYSRALGRYFAEILSGLILYIGYIMVAFDEEKRALHDRICGTRVVYR